MAQKSVYLLSYRESSNQRAHFAIYVPDADFPGAGTLIHVIGAPMAGYQLEIKQGYNLGSTRRRYNCASLGEVAMDDLNRMISYASNVRPPPISENFMAPVDGVKNKRCQEWTTEFVQYLVDKRILDISAVATIQSMRDPPNFGIGLRRVG